jgi:hypothetical protein
MMLNCAFENPLGVVGVTLPRGGPTVERWSFVRVCGVGCFVLVC